MQNASSQKPLLLVTIGLPGAGKSYFARRFADIFNAPVVSFDEIRFELFNEMTFSSDENAIVSRVAAMQLRELMRTRKTIIIDGGYNPKVSRMELAKLAKDAGYTILYAWIQTDSKTARQRSLRRKPSNDDDRHNRSLTAEEFELHMKKFTEPSGYEKYIVISGRHNFPSQARIVLKRMLGPREDIQIRPDQQQKPKGRDSRPISI